MGSYLMMLYVTGDQERALKSYFTHQGWPFKKPDLTVTTEEIGGVVQNSFQYPDEPAPALQEKYPSNKRKAPQKQNFPAKIARHVLPTSTNAPSKSNVIQGSAHTITAYEDTDAKVEMEDEVSNDNNATVTETSETVNAIVIERQDFVVKVEDPDSYDESDADTIDNDFDIDIPVESDVASKAEPSDDIPETRTLDQPGTSSEMGPSGKSKPSKDIRVCGFCGLVFKSTTGLKDHEDKRHRGIGRYSCCGKTYMNLTGLTRHRCHHHGEKKTHVCHICNKAFATRADLNRHVRREKENTVNCNVCGKEFKSQEYLNVHMDQHDSSRSRKHCTLCGKSFADRGGLSRHKRLKHKQ